MSYNQPGKVKQFVKAKPLAQPKQKPPFQREPRKNIRKYQQKTQYPTKDPRQHIKYLLNQFKPLEKNQNVIQLCKNFPRFFTLTVQKPQPQVQANFVQYLWFGNKKQPMIKQSKQMSSDSSEPDWQSDEQKQLKLVSKKIDEKIIEKVNNNSKRQSSKKLDQLQRHQKQFLQDYYKQKRLHLQQQRINQIEKEENQLKNIKKQQKIQKQVKQVKQQTKPVQEQDQWAQYDPNVGALITGGFIQKIQNGQDDQYDEDFSYQSQKSKNSSSEDQDDDMFTDEGPRTITKTKEDKTQVQKKQASKQIVSISSHIFTQIAQQVGAHPQTCVWIISNKLARYRVSTQYMNEYYRSSGLSNAFPYVSLNHSQFVSNEDIQSEKGLAKFKQPNERKRKVQNNYTKSKAKPNNPHYKQKK